MRATVVAGLGGLVIGHVLWLAGIELATRSQNVSLWVLVVALISLLGAAAGAWFGRIQYQRRAFAKAAFLWGLPVGPLLFSLSVLGVTYL